MSIRDNLSVVDRSQKQQINACKRVGIYEKFFLSHVVLTLF